MIAPNVWSDVDGRYRGMDGDVHGADGRRQYTVRYAGKYSLDDFGDMIVTWQNGAPVHLRDVARVERVMVDSRV